MTILIIELFAYYFELAWLRFLLVFRIIVLECISVLFVDFTSIFVNLGNHIELFIGEHLFETAINLYFLKFLRGYYETRI